MERIISTLNLDFTDNDSLLTVNVMQGDALGRTLKLQLYSGGVRVNVGSGDTATLNASTNGVLVEGDLTCQIVENAVYVPVTANLTSVAGICRCVVKIVSSLGTIHTARFNLNVGSKPGANGEPEVIATSPLIDRISAIESSYVDSLTVRHIVSLTQTAYDALSTYDSATLYCIIPEASS